MAAQEISPIPSHDSKERDRGSDTEISQIPSHDSRERDRGSDTEISPIPSHDSRERDRGSDTHAMKKRVGAFTGGIVTMMCPVLAIALKEGDMKSEGNGFVRGSISRLAPLTLEAGLLPFLCLCLSKLLTEWLSDRLYRASKLLVHLCALLLMAYGILLLIFSKKSLPYLAVIVPLVPFTLWRCYWSVCNGPDQDAVVYRGCEDRLEISVDFSTAITTLLFLGLEGLALEGQNSAHQDRERMHAYSLGFTFVACALGVFSMLLGTVPPPITDNGRSEDTCNLVETLNIVLAVFIAKIVYLITFAALGMLAWLVFVPLFVTFLVWMGSVVLERDQALTGAEAEEACKPASLELTQVTFMCFLAASVPTISNTSIPNYVTRSFIVLTAAAVISGLGWRLLTHRMAPSPMRAMVTAANVASFFAYLCFAVAVIPFAMTAEKAH